MRRLFAILAVLVLVFLAGCKSETSPGEVKIEIPPNGAEQPAQTPAENQTTAPAGVSADEETETKLGESSAPAKECDESAAIGYIPGSCGAVDNGIELTIKKSDKGDIEGVEVNYVEGDLVLGTETLSEAIAAGTEKTLKLDTSKYSPKGVKIVPLVGGSGCINQQIYVPMTSCR